MLTPELAAGQINAGTASAHIPLTARLAHEIPKPRDWQAFQRNCVLLFREELGDPNAQEYGRNGQNQGGIDVLGARHGNPEHYVGVQCRHVVRPLNEAGILKECRAALQLGTCLKELIFATTAPDDTGAADAAVAVEQTLRGEGHDLRVVVYGWGQLQTLIAVHEVAYAAFCPSIVGTSLPLEPTTTRPSDGDFAAQVATHVVEQLRATGIVRPPPEAGAAGSNDEDPALHARIDIYRDLLRDQEQPRLAEKGLLALLEKEQLDGKPWTRFRIQTNLGAVALDLGDLPEGAAWFEAAYAVRPNDPKAVANLALARTIQGQFDEAMDLAHQALGATPRADHAVSYLLQAAARSTWQGDPETLIPPDLVGSDHADLGLAEFLRRRNVSGWAERSLQLCDRHPGVDTFKRIRAIAVLALATETGSFFLGGRSPVDLEDVTRAADDMKAVAEHCLDIGFSDEHDLVAYLGNAAVLLRFSDRQEECEALLRRGILSVPNEPSLRRMLASVQASDGRRPDALETLAAIASDPESQLMNVEIGAADDLNAALATALAIDVAPLSTRLRYLRWQLIGELALKIGDKGNLQGAISGLRALDVADATADLLEIRGEKIAGSDTERVQDRLRALVATLPADADMVTRYIVAEELHDQDLPEEAAGLLEGYVDLARRSPATMLYLQSLVAARRDDAFRKAVAAAAPAVRGSPEVLWMVATHAWNLGDLPTALRSIEALLAQQPNHPGSRLLKVEILVRQDRSGELLAELDQPLEDLGWTRLQDRFRVASLLGYFGYLDRATAFAYRLFLEHQDRSQAWMTLAELVLKDGMGESDGPCRWDAPVVAPNVAVDLRYDDGEDVFFIVEPNAMLRRLDDESWEPEHALVQTLMGRSPGARFIGATGREGTIRQLRHKYVARFHNVMERHAMRFPMVDGFRLIPVDVEQPGGLDGLIAELKARHDWIEQEQELYRNGPWPLGVLAHRVGLDVIDVAGGLAAQGISLKVAMGNEPEREAALYALRQNAGKGCVLDLHGFWTAWCLDALDAITATCGVIHLPQSVMDHLRARRERIHFSAKDGMRSARYEAGKLAVYEVAPEVVAEGLDDLVQAIAWAEAHATIAPLVAGDDLPDALREHLRAGKSDIFDCAILAIQTGLLLVTDDLPTRSLSRLVGAEGGTWLHQVFIAALEQRQIDVDTYIRWTAHLIDAGHNYIGISGQVLVRALRMDFEAGQAPGYLFKALTRMIGGRNAEPRSHIAASRDCLRALWSSYATLPYRQPATGHLLRQLLHERFDDYGPILRTLIFLVQDLPLLIDYIQGWAQGHFIADALVVSGLHQESVPHK